MEIGDYANIILIAGTGDATFKSDFICSDYNSTNVKYASGLTYDVGTNIDDVDVFYVSCIKGNGQGQADLLVNHQRYHT